MIELLEKLRDELEATEELLRVSYMYMYIYDSFHLFGNVYRKLK